MKEHLGFAAGFGRYVGMGEAWRAFKEQSTWKDVSGNLCIMFSWFSCFSMEAVDEDTTPISLQREAVGGSRRPAGVTAFPRACPPWAAPRWWLSVAGCCRTHSPQRGTRLVGSLCSRLCWQRQSQSHIWCFFFPSFLSWGPSVYGGLKLPLPVLSPPHSLCPRGSPQ